MFALVTLLVASLVEVSNFRNPCAWMSSNSNCSHLGSIHFHGSSQPLFVIKFGARIGFCCTEPRKQFANWKVMHSRSFGQSQDIQSTCSICVLFDQIIKLLSVAASTNVLGKQWTQRQGSNAFATVSVGASIEHVRTTWSLILIEPTSGAEVTAARLLQKASIL